MQRLSCAFLLSVFSLWAQDAAPPAQPQRQSQARPVTLRTVHKVFVDPMAHDLDKYIREEIIKQMKERIVVVVDKNDADAILTGIDEEETGAGKKLTGRYLGLHNVAKGTLSLLDQEGKVLIWSDDAGDQAMIFTNLKKGGQRKVASRLVGKFRKALMKADYH
ncbi:MAG TPA: hypothetical protein VGL72_24950 [Bryobacteraceae bacterium]|jgi:hypothetical protein